jgi:hypothetical protein
MTAGVTFLSIMHKAAAIDQDTMKPEITQIYKKKTKGVWTHWTSYATHILY